VVGKNGKPRVLKIFRFDKGGLSDAQARQEVAHIQVNTAALLRTAPPFLARFGAIIPNSEAIAEGAILQDLITSGVTWKELSSPLAAIAREEARAAIALAEQFLGGLPTSKNVNNFLYAPATGRIVGWFDHLSHGHLHRHLELGRAQGFHQASPTLSRLQPATASLQGRHPPTLSRAFARLLRDAELVRPEPNQAGASSANLSWILYAKTACGEVKSLWKAGEGERATLPGYPLGELFKNEVHAARLASQVGIEGLVTQAVDRSVNGAHGSVQPWHEEAMRADAKPPEGARFHRFAAELLRVFDYLVGNPDRQGRNMLVLRVGNEYWPLGIDYGLSFPSGPMGGTCSYPAAWVEGQVGPLLPETIDFIQHLKAEEIANSLARWGVPLRASVHTIRRLGRLQRDPSFLEIKAPGKEAVTAMVHAVDLAGHERFQGLSEPEVEAINAMVLKLYGQH
jgi:hypothetical protein